MLNDTEMEESILGALLLSKDALVVARSILVASDFFHPNNQRIFQACMDLYDTGQPVDVASVAHELDRAQLLEMIGGRQRILWLQAQTPASANAAHYAAKVAELAQRRQLLALAYEIQEAVPDLTKDLDEITSSIITSAKDVTGVSQTNLFPNFEEWSKGVGLGYNWLVPGVIERRDRVMLIAKEGAGKALAVDTPILTTSGWKTMGTLSVGDNVYSPTGEPTEVIACTDVMTGRSTFEVGFSDGASIVCDEEHEWATIDYRRRQIQDKSAMEYSVSTTGEIRETLRARSGHCLNHAIPVSNPLRGDRFDLPIPPYTLGAWLGDGTSIYPNITTADFEILERIKADGFDAKKIPSAQYGYRIIDSSAMFKHTLRDAGVLNNKHIPEQYLRASFEQRLELLQGLMDTDGTVDGSGHGHGRGHGAARMEFCVCDKRLAYNVLELIRSLGILSSIRESPAKLYGRTVGTRYRVVFQTELPVFTLQRKLDRMSPLRTKRSQLRYVKSVEKVASVPVRCIQVSNEDGLYLAGRDLIPTHNSFLLRAFGLMLAAGVHWFTREGIAPGKALVIDVENSDRQIVRNTKRFHDFAKQRVIDFDPDNFVIVPMAQGIDLNKRSDRLQVEAYIAGHRPDLLIIGPMYKLFSSSSKMTYEENAMRAVAVIDDWRARYDIAVLIEHHAPKGSDGRRTLDPLGSSVWLRWPEFGLTLDKDEDDPTGLRYEIGRFRNDREVRDWPDYLMRHADPTKKDWPIVAIDPPTACARASKRFEVDSYKQPDLIGRVDDDDEVELEFSDDDPF